MATSAIVVEQGKQGFSSLFGEMWLVSATVDPASVAAEASGVDTIAVPGLRLGDMVTGWAPGVTINSNLVVQVWVSATDVLSIMFTNNNVAAGAAIDVATSTWRFLVGRPRNSGNAS